MSNICCCSLAGTAACLTCANAMSGVGDRYPAPYVRSPEYDLTAWKQRYYGGWEVSDKFKEYRAKQADVEKIMQEHRELGLGNMEFFGDGGIEEQVAPV